MKNNTVVIAADAKYFWGVFIAIASMRKNGMDEPVLVYQCGFTDEMKRNLGRFGDVEIVTAPKSDRSFATRKAEAMLVPTSEYVTWVDADGFFLGNCSELLPPESPEDIHIRVREDAEFSSYLVASGDSRKRGEYARIWARDVGVPEDAMPRIRNGVSSCFLSVHRSQRPFLEWWDRQMLAVLVDRSLKRGPYYLLDEPVLSSLLMYLPNAPLPKEFRLDKVLNRRFRHMVGVPKPWVCWSAETWRFHSEVMEIISWSRGQGFIDLRLPFCLNPDHGRFHRSTLFLAYAIRLKMRLRKIWARSVS